MRIHEGIRQTSKEAQESFESVELERTSIFHWLRERGFMIYMAATLSSGIPFKHERLEAAEIPPTATWSEGIKVLENGTLNDEVETAATFYIDNQTKRKKWISSKEGEATVVVTKPIDLAKDIKNEIEFHPTQSITLCDLHTHPLRAGEFENIISKEKRRSVQEAKHSVSFPPSGYAGGGDIGIGLEEWAIKSENKGVSFEFRSGVVDPAGITYHRRIDPDELMQELPHFQAELEQRAVISKEWYDHIKSVVRSLDETIINRLHGFIIADAEYNEFLEREFTPEKRATEDFKRWTLERKRSRLEDALFYQERKGAHEITEAIIAHNLDLRKIHDKYVQLVINAYKRDMEILDQARLAWTKTSMRVPPEKMVQTEVYHKLRKAYARQMTHIRFVPHSEVPNEPPCAGPDYKKMTEHFSVL